MLSGLLVFLASLPICLLWDWSCCTRLAAYSTEFSYRYKPGKVRYAALTAAAAIGSYGNATYDPSRPSMIGLVMIFSLVALWGVFAFRDVKREQIPNEFMSKRYAERDH